MSQDYEKFYIPRNLDQKKIIFLDPDEFVISLSFFFAGILTKKLIIALIIGVPLLYYWRQIKGRDYNYVTNLRYFFFGGWLKFKRAPKPYILTYYG